MVHTTVLVLFSRLGARMMMDSFLQCDLEKNEGWGVPVELLSLQEYRLDSFDWTVTYHPAK
jgi:hypothetical protein